MPVDPEGDICVKAVAEICLGIDLSAPKNLPHMAYNQITDKLWLGSLLALSGRNSLRDLGVTHILSVLDMGAAGVDEKSFTESVSADFEHLYLNVQDVEEEDIMQYFEQTNAFINGAITGGGGVLVHCIAGVSRSTTCVCAWLMSERRIRAGEAIQYVRERRSIAHPNEGFREQLEVYYKCGFRVSTDLKPYREWKLKQQARELEFQSFLTLPTMYTPVRMPPSSILWWHILPKLCDSPAEAARVKQVRIDRKLFAISEPVSVSFHDDTVIELLLPDGTKECSAAEVRKLIDQTSRKVIVLRCKGCSTTLATSASFVFHEKGTRGECQHWFLEPIEWMRPELEKGEIEGRLVCPKCNHKLGSYLWQGSQCSCGVWVTPSFKFQKSRVDNMTITEKPAL